MTSKDPVECSNAGMRVNQNTMYTYTQSRVGFSYFYCKREVLPDGVRTKPLNITLSPWNLQERVIFDGEWEPFSPNYKYRLIYDGKEFYSSEQMFNYRCALSHNRIYICNGIESCVNSHELNRCMKKFKMSPRWLEIRNEIMMEIITLKMRQVNEVRQALSQSISKPLVYACRNDCYWGVGVSKRVAMILSEEEYHGRNSLGLFWEDVREKYQDEIAIQGVNTPQCDICTLRKTSVTHGVCLECSTSFF